MENRCVRPATAPLRKGNPQNARPLGRPSSSLAHLRLAVALHDATADDSLVVRSASPLSPTRTVNTGAASISSLKGEIMLVQKLYETIVEQEEKAPLDTPRVGTPRLGPAPRAACLSAASETEIIERQLLSVQTSAMSDANMVEAKAMLLELLIERMKAASIQALRLCDPDALLSLSPSRTAAFSAVLQHILSIRDRKKLWEKRLSAAELTESHSADTALILYHGARAADASSHTGGGSHNAPHVDTRITASIPATTPLTLLDLALNEPTSSQIQKLIDEQRALQVQLKKLLNDKAIPSPMGVAEERQRAASVVSLAGGKAGTKEPSEVSVSSLAKRRPTSATKKAQADLQFESIIKQKNSENAHLKEQIEHMHREISTLKKMREEVEASVSVERANEKAKLGQLYSEWDLRCRVVGAAFGSESGRLEKLGITIDSDYMGLGEAESVAIVQRIQGLFTETIQFCAESSSSAKGRRLLKALYEDAHAKTPRSTREASLTGHLSRVEALDAVSWVTLHHQNEIITKLLDTIDLQQAAWDARETALLEEVGSKNRSVGILEAKLSGLQTSVRKLQLQKGHSDGHHEQTAILRQSISNVSSEPERIVPTKNQKLTSAEREAMLRQDIVVKDKKISTLTEQIRGVKADADLLNGEISSLTREKKGLLVRLDAEAQRVATLEQQLADSVTTQQQAQDHAATMKRDLRVKTVLEEDNSQKIWKLQVELHISQNVIAELRKREQSLLLELEDATEQRRLLREENESSVLSHQRTKSEFELRIQELTAALDASKFSLHQERQQTLANEKEMERLRVVDVQLETMENNFNNYAVSMIVKREAGEEEERVLGECLDQVQRDVFSIPSATTVGEEELLINLRKLAHRKEMLENEERVQRQAEVTLVERKKDFMLNSANPKTQPDFRNDTAEEIEEMTSISAAERNITNKKKLGLLLQKRMVEIQIFACERRVQELRRNRDLRATETELSSVQHVHGTMLKDLSQTRSQLDAMTQRNSELELERRQLLKDRNNNEATIKRLQAHVQRLQVTSESQEQLLVDVGTRLQNQIIHSASTAGADIHVLPQVLP